MLVYWTQLLLIAFSAQAQHPVTVDPGAFEGLYRVDNSSYGTGLQSFNLIPGLHRLYFANNAHVDFTILEDGKIIYDNKEALSLLDNKIRLQTTAVQIDPKNYKGYYSILGSLTLKGPANVTLINGIENRLVTDIGGLITHLFVFNGQLISSTENVQLIGRQVVFKTRTLTVLPGRYLGQYMLGDWSALSGKKSVVVVENAHHRIRTIENGTIANFHVDENGQVHIAPYGHSNLILSKDTIKFKTKRVHVKRGDYRGGLVLSNVSLSANVNTVDLILDAEHRISTTLFSTVSDIVVHKDSIFIRNPDAVKANGRNLLLQSIKVRVSPSLLGGYGYTLDSFDNFYNSETISFIKNVEYMLRVYDSLNSFTVTTCESLANFATPYGHVSMQCEKEFPLRKKKQKANETAIEALYAN
jgi:hypothetical protein